MPFSFGIDASGNYGYKKAGADTVTPFKKGYEDTPGTATAADITEGCTAWVNGELITGIRPAAITQQSGTISAYLSVGSTVSNTVTFDSPFESTPTISTTRLSSGDGCNGYYCKISNVSVTGFSWKIGGQQYGNDTIQYRWVASV